MVIASRPCPDIGVWLSWLDHEDESPSLAEHLSGCPGCQRLVADLHDDAVAIGRSLSLLAPARLPSPTEVASARERLARRDQRDLQPVRNGALLSRISTPWRAAASA